MSVMRPHLKSTTDPAVYDGTAYLVILKAVEQQDGLCHGRLDDDYGAHCAVGSYFATPRHMALPSNLIDEVATVNDSVPHYTAKQRKQFVRKWLRWRLAQLEMPDFRRWATGSAPKD